MPNNIEITNASNYHKMISFKIKDLEDGILIGLVYPNLPLDDPKQGLSIAYQGDVVKVPFTALKQSDIQYF